MLLLHSQILSLNVLHSRVSITGFSYLRSNKAFKPAQSLTYMQNLPTSTSFCPKSFAHTKLEYVVMAWECPRTSWEQPVSSILFPGYRLLLTRLPWFLLWSSHQPLLIRAVCMQVGHSECAVLHVRMKQSPLRGDGRSFLLRRTLSFSARSAN